MAVADTVRVRYEVQNGQAIVAQERYQRAAERSMTTSTRAVRQAETQIVRSSEAIKRALLSSVSVLATGFSVQAIQRYADAYTELQNRLTVTGLSGQNLIAVEDRLFAAANRNGVAVNSLAETYSRAALSSKELGATQDQLLQFTDALSDAVRVQGTTTQAASGALLQLSQALGAGTVRAEEFNSIIEGLPILAQTAAKNIERYGGSVSKLRADVVDGKVTSQEFFQAILKGSGDLAAQASKANLTISASFQVLNNELGRYIGQADKSLSASQKVSQAIQGVANNLDTIIPAIATLSALIGARMVAALGASTIATIADAAAKARAKVAADAFSRSLAANTGMLNANAVAAQRAAASTLGFGGAMRTAGSMAGMAGNAILGVFGGPVGLAITGVTLAIAAVTAESIAHNASVKSLTKTYEEYEAEQRAVSSATKTANKEQKDLIKQIDPAIVKLANQTGQVNKLSEAWFQLAAAARLAAIEQARAASESARNEANEAKKARDRNRMRGSGLLTHPETGQVIGSPSQFKEVREADKIYDALDRRANEYEERLKRLQTDAITPLPVPKAPTATEGGKKTSKSDAAAAKRREETAETLRLERELLLAQETGDKKRIQAAEDAIRLRQLLNQYTESGAADAAKSAGEHLAIEQRIRDSEEAREETQKRINAMLDKAQENTERYARATERLADIERDRLNHNLDLARLRGDEKAVRAAERELRIRERIDELTRRGDADPVGNANREADEREIATRYGQYRDMFANAFSEGIRAAASGDLQSFISNMVGSATERALQNLGGKLFDATGLGGVLEGILGPDAADPIETGIISGGSIAATEIASAMTAAGASVAAMIASATTANAVSNTSSQIASFLDGARASGGPVKAGGAYLVGEKGPEILKMGGMGGKISPNNLMGNIPNGSALTRRQPLSVTVRNSYQIEGAIGREEIARSIERAQVQTANRVTQTVKRSLSGWNNNLNTLGNV